MLLFALGLNHPACQLTSLAGGLAYGVRLYGGRGLARRMIWLAPAALAAAVLNPLFSHQGITILTYFPSGNPLTLESLLYGLSAGGLLAAVLIWFSCYHVVMTSDKFLYLFGRVIPALSLVLSMTLGFVPKVSRQLRAVTQAQRSLGRDLSQGGLVKRLRTAAAIFSILVTWSLESAILTADSMRSRGYGLPGRTAFSIYRLEERDQGALIWLAAWGVFVALGWAAGGFSWRYYPSVSGAAVTPLTGCFLLGYLSLCFTPVAIGFWEDRLWRESRR